MEKIVIEVAKHYNIYWKTLFSPGKSNQKQALARNMSVLLIFYFYPNMSTTQMGRYFNKDHSTIVHGRKVLLGEMKIYKQIANDYDNLLEKLKEMDLSHSNCLSIVIDDCFVKLRKMKTK